MSNSESKYESTHYSGQETLLPRGEVCLQAMLQDVGMPVERLARTQTVHEPQVTHAGMKREVICDLQGCGAVVVIETRLNDQREEIITGYDNPRVSRPFEGCEETIPLRVMKRKPAES